MKEGLIFAVLPGEFRFCLHSTGVFFCGEKNIGTRLLVGKIRRTGGGRWEKNRPQSPCQQDSEEGMNVVSKD